MVAEDALAAARAVDAADVEGVETGVPGRADVGRAVAGFHQRRSSNRSARSMSFSVMPPASWVVRRTSTSRQEIVISG